MIASDIGIARDACGKPLGRDNRLSCARKNPNEKVMVSARRLGMNDKRQWLVITGKFPYPNVGHDGFRE